METFLKTLFSCIIFLTTLNVPAQEEFIVKISGSGEPVLLFPGFTSTGEVWGEVAEELAQHFEVHSFTFAGFGGVAPIETPWFPKIKSAMQIYVKNHKLKDPVIVGHSMGGTLGLWLAAEDPGFYKKIIVVDALPAMGALMMPNYNSENIVYENPYNDQLLQMSDSSFAAMASQMASAMTINKGKQDLLKKWIIETDRETYVYGYTDLLKLDLRKDLAKITSPVAILGATQPYGKEAAEKNYREQYKNLASYTLEFAENSGHFIMFDKPEWFLEKLKAELSF